MDYINYVKEYPVQGLTGLYGGVQGALQQAAAGGGAVNYGNRAIGYGGEYPGNTGTVIDYFAIDTTSNASNFGSCNAAGSRTKGGGNLTRGLRGGGDPDNTSIEYITYSSTGNGTDFGNLNQQRNYVSSGGNGTRQLWQGGSGAGSSGSTVDYVTIETAANAGDFGDCTPVFTPGNRSAAGGGDDTRVVFMGGDSPHTDTIGYYTAESTGNATNFGNLTAPASYVGSAYNGTKQWRMGGYSPAPGNRVNVVDAVTIQTTSNATDWGDLLSTWRYSSGSSNGPRFVNIGGDDGGAYSQGETGYFCDKIQYFSSDSTGNATDFGDLTQGRNGLAGMSGNA